MAPNKFEKHIKKELQEREIQPSANAWEVLSKKLDADAPESKKRSFLWYGIAASLVGLLIVSILFFNFNNSTDAPDMQIVDTTDEVNEVEVNNVIDEKAIKVVDNKEVKHKPAKEVKLENQTPRVRNQIVSVEEIDPVVETTIEKEKISNGFNEEIISSKILEVVAKVDSMELNNTALTNAEVDELLRNAQDEILLDKFLSKNGKVDAVALLTEVEDELDKSFRDQIFESLKTGFLKVRTAVADRNK